MYESPRVAPNTAVPDASDGIDRAFAQRLAHEGYRITAVARNEARLHALVASLPGEGHEVLVADLSADELSATHLAHALLARAEPGDAPRLRVIAFVAADENR